MVDILGADIPTPGISFSGSYWIWITVFVILAAAVIIIGLVVYLVIQWKTYNKKIILFENLSGQGYQPTVKDRARTVKVGTGGEEILYLKKLKVYRGAYGRKMGKNTFWFAVGPDGYWYNFLLGDLDAKMGILDVEPVDRDMRLMHAAIRKNAEDRYGKKKMEKIVMITIGGVALCLIITFVGLWYNLAAIGDMIKELATTQEANQVVAKSMETIAGHLDAICGGSGFTTAS